MSVADEERSGAGRLKQSGLSLMLAPALVAYCSESSAFRSEVTTKKSIIYINIIYII